jgi:hypothetical protein
MTRKPNEDNHDTSREAFEKRGHVPPKDRKVTPQDFKNAPDGPAPGANPSDTPPKDKNDS